MKNSLMSIADKILLRKRALIETVNDELKNIEQREKSLPLIRITPIQRKAKMTLKMIHLNTSLTDICSLLIIQLIVIPCISAARALKLKYWQLMLPAIATILIWQFGLSPVYIVLAGIAGGMLYTLWLKDKLRKLQI